MPTGTLTVRVDEAAWPLDALCAFAARRNPKRGFLVVSKVLGRHWPAAPATMRAAARDLAARVPADLPGPVVVVGLAETAVCLGQTLHAEWRRRTGREDALFLHSTRQLVDAPKLGRFEEPHSHASSHILYEPVVAGFDAPRSLVLVDDEVSTGTTLANIAAVLVARWPSVERIVVASLTDWSEGGWLRRLPRPAERASLLAGGLEWTPAPVEAEMLEAPAGSLGRLEAHRNRGRLGIVEGEVDLPTSRHAGLVPASTAPQTAASAAPWMPEQVRHDEGWDTLALPSIRIVGTGEFTYPPFLLAEQLAAQGHDVVVQATSRSPARIGGAVRHALVFEDNYGTGVPNYLYNADPADGRLTLVCHETPAIDPALLEALNATPIAWPA